MQSRKITIKSVVTVDPTDSVVNAARLMAKKSVGSVVIVKNKKPVGILTD